ncbi:MAG: hypothetical protein ABEI99_12700 [Halobaculum sp.]
MGIGPLDALVRLIGPFALPVLLFVLGLIGYLVLVGLNRLGIEL